jgi:hypothetical protein
MAMKLVVILIMNTAPYKSMTASVLLFWSIYGYRLAMYVCPPAYLLEPVLLRLGRLTHLALQLLLLPTHGPNNYEDINPKCRLYLGLIEFIDWRHRQSSWYLQLAL